MRADNDLHRAMLLMLKESSRILQPHTTSPGRLSQATGFAAHFLEPCIVRLLMDGYERGVHGLMGNIIFAMSIPLQARKVSTNVNHAAFAGSGLRLLCAGL